MKSLILCVLVAGALGASCFAPANAEPRAQPSGVVAAKPAPTIDTYGDWTGAFAEHFGRPDIYSPTYGQVITVPADETDLVRFRFYLSHSEGMGHLILRGEVYQWDGHKATGAAVWEGAPRRITLRDGDGFGRVGFHVGGAELTAGAEYVLFASISKDYEQCTPGYLLRWAVAPNESYRAGTFVYSNDGGDESHWTRQHWTRADYDAAFKAWLRPHSP